MSRKWIFPLLISLGLLLAACSAAPQKVESVATAGVAAPPAEAPEVERVMPTAEPPPEQPVVEQVAPKGVNIPQDRVNRLIIKNGELTLEVEDTDVAIDRVTQVAGDLGGYIISSRSNIKEVDLNPYKYATLTIGVPSGDFEVAMRRLREIALRVLDDTASGEDVTDEYVDLESRLDNLKATRDRIREFLDQAQTVEEALKVNEQLSEIEEEIEQVQGRMNYLFDRASYSTITIYLQPFIPQSTPTVTPTPRPTPTPTPWRPGDTFQDATSTLGQISRGLVDFSIYFSVVCLPFIIPLALLAWLAFRLFRRYRTSHPRPVKQPAYNPYTATPASQPLKPAAPPSPPPAPSAPPESGPAKPEGAGGEDPNPPESEG